MLGDLDPNLWPYTRWWCNDDAVLLVYHRFGVPVLVSFGPAEAARLILDEMPCEPVLYLHVSPDVQDLLQKHYEVAAPLPMIRMSLRSAETRLIEDTGTTRLDSEDADAVEQLYCDGANRGEAPNFFLREMIDTGIYYGVREGGRLIAVAGTHFVTARGSAAAIGNVYTRHDQRRRGLAARCTSAVASALIDAGIGTIALSVGEDNAAAILIYQRLGFREHCRFVEGVARLR